jgi:uncharacterized protein (TIGR02300 family)
VAKPEWGAKHTCQHCGVKYYDLLRSPAICPQCKTAFNPDALLRSRRSKPAPPEKAPAAVAAGVQAAAGGNEEAEAVEQEEEAVEKEDEDLVAVEGEKDGTDELAESDDEDDKLIEDASELGEDDEDVAEVLVGDGKREDT